MMMSKRLFAKVALTGVGAALVARAAQALDRAPLKDSVAVPETIDPAKLSDAWDKVFPEDRGCRTGRLFSITALESLSLVISTRRKP